MEILIHKFYKSKNGSYVVIMREPGFCATRLVAKPRRYKLIEGVAISIVQDFLNQKDITIKFVDDPDDDIAITYYETCYGWEA